MREFLKKIYNCFMGEDIEQEEKEHGCPWEYYFYDGQGMPTQTIKCMRHAKHDGNHYAILDWPQSS